MKRIMRFKPMVGLMVVAAVWLVVAPPQVFVNGKLLRNINFREFEFKIEKELQKIREEGNP